MIIQKWKQCGTRAQGKDHINAGVVCQDNVAALEKNGVHAIALSDGGGSRKYSEVGSACSTVAACRLLAEKFDEYFDLTSVPRLEVSCKNGVYRIEIVFEAERIKKFNVLK